MFSKKTRARLVIVLKVFFQTRYRYAKKIFLFLNFFYIYILHPLDTRPYLLKVIILWEMLTS